MGSDSGGEAPEEEKRAGSALEAVRELDDWAWGEGFEVPMAYIARERRAWLHSWHFTALLEALEKRQAHMCCYPPEPCDRCRADAVLLAAVKVRAEEARVSVKEEDGKYLTTTQAGELLGESRSAVRKRVAAKKLRGKHFSDALLVDRAQVEGLAAEALKQHGQYLSTSQAGELLGVSSGVIRGRVRKGKLSGKRFGRVTLVDRVQVEQLAVEELAEQ